MSLQNSQIKAGRDLLRSPGPISFISRLLSNVSRWGYFHRQKLHGVSWVTSQQQQQALPCVQGRISCASVCTHCLLSCHQGQQDILLIAPATKQDLSCISFWKCRDLFTFIRSFIVYTKLEFRVPWDASSPLDTIIRQSLKRRFCIT